MKAFQKLIAIVLSIGALSAYADLPKKVEALYEQVERPRIEEVLNAFGGKLPEKNPFPFHDDLNWHNAGRTLRPTEEEYRDLFLHKSPLTIARMERAFPGAIWVTVGRDSALLGDLLDSYYRQFGKKNRVRRLEISTGSHGDQEIFLRYLQQLGVKLTPAALKKAPPVIFIDRTSYGTWRSSDSVETLKLIYHAYADAGGDPKDLVRKVNFLTTEPVSMAASSARSINADVVGNGNVESFLAQQEKRVKESGGAPERILALGSDLTDLAEWHDSYVDLREEGGKIVAIPGPPSDRQLKDRVLWELFEVAKATQNPEFVKSVNSQLQTLGVDGLTCRKVLRKVRKPVSK